MECKECGTINSEGSTVCSNCNKELTSEVTQVDNNNNNNDNNEEQPKNNSNIISIIILVIISFILFITFIVLLIIYLIPSRDSKLSDTNNNSIIYKYDQDEFNISTAFSNYIDKGYYVLDNDYTIKYDSISMSNIYKDDIPIGLAAFYCPKKEGCLYKDSNVIKINLYNNGKVSVKDISYSTSKNKVFEILGKEAGTLSSDKLYYVWSNGKNIGDSYIMIRFRNSSIEDIKIGVWWYDGEYNHLVKEEK